MHELSVVQNVLDRAQEIAVANGNLPIEKIHIKVGVYQNIVPMLLSFSFKAAREGTLASSADLTWESVSLKVQCDECQTQYAPESMVWSCPDCGTNRATLLEGNELVLDHVLLQEPENTVAVTA